MYPLTITGLFYLFSSFEMSSEPTTSTDLPYKKLGKKKYQGAPKILNLALEYIQYLQHHIYIIRAIQKFPKNLFEAQSCSLSQRFNTATCGYNITAHVVLITACT